jgi:hypothetical protein
MSAAPVSAASSARRVESVLARFELACPSLRDFQVSVEILGRQPELVVLPAQGKPKGRIEFVVTQRGGLRTCAHPKKLSVPQRRAVEDIAWSLRDALTGTEAPPTPRSKRA